LHHLHANNAAMMRPSIRFSVIFWAIALLTCLGYIIARLLVFKQIFFEHAGIVITQPQVANAHNFPDGGNDTRPQLIPKIIHQVFHNWHDPGNETLPGDWNKVRLTCTDANPDFEYMVRSPVYLPNFQWRPRLVPRSPC
jgi:inositol phosphorylceramide mannosyltransferase catalytic subunit